MRVEIDFVIYYDWNDFIEIWGYSYKMFDGAGKNIVYTRWNQGTSLGWWQGEIGFDYYPYPDSLCSFSQSKACLSPPISSISPSATDSSPSIMLPISIIS